jgi:hypothetical protein
MIAAEGWGFSMRTGFVALSLTAALTICFSATADPEGCRAAIDQFKSARSDVSTDLRTYASCVSGSNGHDDCSSEFSALQSAHDDFESAVSEYESECD